MHPHTHTYTHARTHSRHHDTMSRIPKFGFGFKKAKGQSIDEAPPVDATPPPPEQETTMKRSKSLRVPRSVARSTYFTPTNDQSDPEPQPTSHLQPAVVSRSGAASNPGSRAASPYVAQPPDEDPQRNTVVVSPTEILPPSSRQRTTSLSAKQGAHTRSRSVVLKATRGTGGVGGGQPPPIVLGRSKTPTATTRLGSAPLRKLTRTNSVENTLSAEQSTSPTPTKTVVKSPMTRTDSSGTTNGHVTTPLSRNGSETKLGKVSRVLAMGEGAADLNKLASEFSESLSSSGQEDVDGAYMSRAGPLANSSIRHSPSPSGGLSDSSPTSPSSQTATSRSLLPPPRSSAGGPPRGLEASSSRSRLVVPSIKVGTTTTAQGSTSRPGSAKAFYSVQVSAHPDAAGPPTADPLPPPPLPTSSSGVARSTSDGSTPSSGRNTPADLRGSLELEGSTKSSVSVEETSKGATTTVAEVTPPPRTPYRVPKVRTAFAGEGGGADHTGLNDLEGSVLLEAEDYRRIAQEVKALKTTLLRFKRELQNEVCVEGEEE